MQKTYLRAASLENAAEIITITNQAYYLKHKVSPGISSCRFLLEPCSRNTAPAIAMAALHVVAQHGPDAVMLILPADHLISDTAAFKTHCEKAFALANQNKLVTFGITPTRPETGFGYIELSDDHHAVRFVEKPDAETAQAFLVSKRYLWNAGMFCFKASVVLEEFAKHAPTLLHDAKNCFRVSQTENKNADIFTFNAELFSQLPTISFDYALMEKSSEIAVLACSFDWQDVGSWESYKNLHQADAEGNTVLGETVLIDAKIILFKAMDA